MSLSKSPTIKVYSTAEIQSRSAYFIAQYLEQELAKSSLLLLLSGGSAIKMYQKVFSQLTALPQTSCQLTVSLFDERFVPKNSTDSNEFQLQKTGVLDQLDQLGAMWIPYLTQQAIDGETVARQVSDQFTEILKRGDHLIILAGIGGDGHTAGLLPTQDQATLQRVHQSSNLVEYYTLSADTDNPYRQRLTATPKLIEQADQVIVYAVGDDKKPALADFKASQKPLNERPSLALHRSKSPVILFTDQKL